MLKQNMPDIGVQIYMNDQHTTIMHYIGCLVYGYMGSSAQDGENEQYLS